LLDPPLDRVDAILHSGEHARLPDVVPAMAPLILEASRHPLWAKARVQIAARFWVLPGRPS
jgi:hypothetical protein